MKRIITDIDPVKIGLLKSVLEEAGIECFVKNLNAAIGVGEIPFIEIWPELWVTKDEDEARARAALENMEMDNVSEQDRVGPWTCGECDSEIVSGMAECWNCGASKPEKEV